MRQSNPRARRIFVSHANAVTVKNALSFIKKITVIPMHAKDAPHCIQKLHYMRCVSHKPILATFASMVG